MPELIDDGINGLLFPLGDVDAMAAAAIDLLRDEASPRRHGLAARRNASDRFCSTRIIPLYEQYYERVLAWPRPSEAGPTKRSGSSPRRSGPRGLADSSHCRIELYCLIASTAFLSSPMPRPRTTCTFSGYPFLSTMMFTSTMPLDLAFLAFSVNSGSALEISSGGCSRPSTGARCWHPSTNPGRRTAPATRRNRPVGT